jgi:anthranilate synthase component 1
MDIQQFPSKERFVELGQTANVVPVCLEMLADVETPVSVLMKLYQQKPPLFLFESVEGGERWGRYSFMGVRAHSMVTVFKDHVTYEKEQQTIRIPYQKDPFGVLRKLMATFKTAPISELPRFWGGLVGYFTYEMVSFIEKIPSKLDADTPLARFCMPDQVLIFDNIQKTLALVAIAFLDEKSDLPKCYDRLNRELFELKATITAPQNLKPANSAAENLLPELKPLLPEGTFQKRVERIKEYILAGDVIQTVVSQPFVCDATIDPIELYRAQRYVNPSPYLFFLHVDDAVLVGSSPETMVRLENRQAVLRPIAGTRPRGNSEQEDRALADDLLKDEKERAEHLMLVDLGRNDLGRIAQTGTVQVTDLMMIERYSHVMHLVSNITCDVKDDCDAWDLFAATFPAGTLSGAPKVRAMEIIDELETRPRASYGGAVGYISFNGNMDLAITIRTAQVENERLLVRAGAGIVADSDPDSEQQETVNKAGAIARALRMIDPKKDTTGPEEAI